jgi:hypothetical protein
MGCPAQLATLSLATLWRSCRMASFNLTKWISPNMANFLGIWKKKITLQFKFKYFKNISNFFLYLIFLNFFKNNFLIIIYLLSFLPSSFLLDRPNLTVMDVEMVRLVAIKDFSHFQNRFVCGGYWWAKLCINLCSTKADARQLVGE